MRERQPGVWQLRVSNGYDLVTGRQLVRTETFRGSKRAASKRLAEMDSTAHRQLSDLMFADAAARWRLESDHSNGTARNYDLADATIPTRFKKLQLRRITAAMVRRLVDGVEKDHNVHRARLVQAYVSGVLSFAWRMEWVSDRVALKVVNKRAPKRKRTDPTPEQMTAILAKVRDDAQLYAWLLLASDLGSRPGETLALRWSHLDLVNGEVHINQALDPMTHEVKTTKTDSERTVAIGADTVAVMKAWKAGMKARADAVGVRLVRDPFVFSEALNGAKPWRTDLGSKRFRRIRDGLGIEGVRLYDLRHYVATQSIGAGVDVRTVAGRLGHTRVSTTTDTYAGVMRARDRTAADALEKLRKG